MILSCQFLSGKITTHVWVLAEADLKCPELVLVCPTRRKNSKKIQTENCLALGQQTPPPCGDHGQILFDTAAAFALAKQMSRGVLLCLTAWSCVRAGRDLSLLHIPSLEVTSVSRRLCGKNCRKRSRSSRSLRFVFCG